MRRRRGDKSFVLTFLVAFLSILTLLVSILFMRDMAIINDAYADLNQIEFISSSTQRMISLAQSGQLMPKDIFFVGDTSTRSLEVGNADALSVLVMKDMVLLSNEVLESWILIEDLLELDELNLIDLTLARDGHFKAMTNLSGGITAYSAEINQRLANYQTVIMILVFIIVMIMLNNLLRTNSELKLSKELAENAQIDLATGLYNRSRCQQLLSNSPLTNTTDVPAVLMLDLNDLKITNDTLGHSTGDELITAFSKALKGACAVHVLPPFVGRYGGDEFIVYYDNLRGGEKEIMKYEIELEYLVNEFNEGEKKFQISYAIGHAMLENDADRPEISVKQLFDLADEAMFVNKAAVKKARMAKFAKENESKQPPVLPKVEQRSSSDNNV